MGKFQLTADAAGFFARAVEQHAKATAALHDFATALKLENVDAAESTFEILRRELQLYSALARAALAEKPVVKKSREKVTERHESGVQVITDWRGTKRFRGPRGSLISRQEARRLGVPC